MVKRLQNTSRRQRKSTAVRAMLPTKGDVLLSQSGATAKISEATFNQDVRPHLVGDVGLNDRLIAGLAKAKLKPGERAGLLIKAMRTSAGLSQDAVGAKAMVKQSEISAIENGSGEKGPTFDVLYRLADACGFSITFVPKTSGAENKVPAAERPAKRVSIQRGAQVQSVHHEVDVMRTKILALMKDLANLSKTAMPLVQANTASVRVQKGDPLLVMADGVGQMFELVRSKGRSAARADEIVMRMVKPTDPPRDTMLIGTIDMKLPIILDKEG